MKTASSRSLLHAALSRTALMLTLSVMGGSVTGAQEAGYQAESTVRMVERLQFLARQIERTPGVTDFANAARVAFLERMTPPPEPAERGGYMAELAQELLRSGRTAEAIVKLTELFEFFSASPEAFPEGYHYALWEALAVAHLRIGITRNCIENESPDGCIVPVDRTGIHAETRDTLIATNLFERVLEANPDDLETIWLLNVAYQMVGGYPDDVPDRWLIPPSAFDSDYDIKPFIDVSRSLGLNTSSNAGGSIMEDFDGDGFLDLMASGWAFTDQMRFFRNKGDGTFEERTEPAGLEGLVRGLHMIHADYDNDGFEDVFVLRGGWMTLGYPNSLLRNNGNGTFDDVTEAAGLLTPTPLPDRRLS